MWIARSEIKGLLERVETLYSQAAVSGDKAIMTGFPGSIPASSECFRDLLRAHSELRVELASLAGRLEAMTMRPWI